MMMGIETGQIAASLNKFNYINTSVNQHNTKLKGRPEWVLLDEK